LIDWLIIYFTFSSSFQQKKRKKENNSCCLLSLCHYTGSFIITEHLVGILFKSLKKNTVGIFFGVLLFDEG